MEPHLTPGKCIWSGWVLGVVMMLTGCAGYVWPQLGNMDQKNDVCPVRSAGTLDPGGCI